MQLGGGFSLGPAILPERPDLGAVVTTNDCAATARHGALARTRKQSGGACPCMLGGGSRKKTRRQQKKRQQKKQKGGAYPCMLGGGSRKKTRRQQKKRQQKKQKGGAGVTYDFNDMLMKEPARITTPCQSGGNLAITAPTAAYTFDLTGKGLAADLKLPYAEVVPMAGRTRRRR